MSAGGTRSSRTLLSRPRCRLHSLRILAQEKEDRSPLLFLAEDIDAVIHPVDQLDPLIHVSNADAGEVFCFRALARTQSSQLLRGHAHSVVNDLKPQVLRLFLDKDLDRASAPLVKTVENRMLHK